MWNRPNRRPGLTLVEMTIAIVILGVGLAGVLLAFQTTVRGSGETLVRRQLLALAEGLLEEALARPVAVQAGAGGGGCARDGFNDVRDYNGYDAAVCRVDGTAVSGLDGYRLQVTVSDATLGSSPALRVRVRASAGSESLELVGWRTPYAP